MTTAIHLLAQTDPLAAHGNGLGGAAFTGAVLLAVLGFGLGIGIGFALWRQHRSRVEEGEARNAELRRACSRTINNMESPST